MTYDCPRCARPFPQHRPQLKPQEAHMFPCHLGQNTSASLLLLFLYNIPRCFTWETRQIPCQSFCLGRRVLLLRLVLMESERDRSKARSPKPFFFSCCACINTHGPYCSCRGHSEEPWGLCLDCALNLLNVYDTRHPS